MKLALSFAYVIAVALLVLLLLALEARATPTYMTVLFPPDPDLAFVVLAIDNETEPDTIVTRADTVACATWLVDVQPGSSYAAVAVDTSTNVAWSDVCGGTSIVDYARIRRQLAGYQVPVSPCGPQ